MATNKRSAGQSFNGQTLHFLLLVQRLSGIASLLSIGLRKPEEPPTVSVRTGAAGHFHVKPDHASRVGPPRA